MTGQEPQNHLRATRARPAPEASVQEKSGKTSKPAKTKHKKPVKKRGIVSTLLTWVISLGALGVLGGSAVIVLVLLSFSNDLPDYQALANYEPPIVTRAYASDGRLLAEFAAEKRVFVPISSIPPLVVQAFLSAEDKHFYQHPGLDFKGIARAMLTNLKNIGGDKRLQGASTITQQVAKNFLLTNEVSYERKIKEAILSFRIEQAFTKDHILELYLNEIFLGYRAYGVAAASLEYFNKPLEELSIAETAFLAALPKAPNNYHPVRRYDAALVRRNWVINEMKENGHITAKEAEEATATPITVITRDDSEYVNHPYFAEEVRRKLLELYGETGLYEGGLIAKTTLHPVYQALAEKSLRAGLIGYDQRHGLHSDPIGRIDNLKNDDKDTWAATLKSLPRPAGGHAFKSALILSANAKEARIGLEDGSTGIITYNKMKWARKNGVTPAQVDTLLKTGDVWLVEDSGETAGQDKIYWLRQVPKIQGAIVVMDPHTGRVYAMSGGFSYDTSQFNRASQAKRQPGSAFKPFIYLTALEEGFTPATLILDAPFVKEQGPGLEKWRPQNYSTEYYGPTTLRRGLEKSRNLMTVRLADYIGMEKVAATAQRFDVIDNMPPFLSYALGAGETTLLRMTTAYSTFVNGGKKVTPTLIDRIQDRKGETIFVHTKSPCASCGPMLPWSEDMGVPHIPDMRPDIADPRHMYQIVSMLEGAIQRGTGVRLKSLNYPIAGKTGTTNDSKDTWFIGFTPDIVVGTYIGFDEPRPMGKEETGSRTAIPVVQAFLEEALKEIPATPFRVPNGIRLVQVNADDGTRAKPGDEEIILEAFLEGTEPGAEAVMFTGKGISPMSEVINVSESADTGLGGLY